MASVLQPQRGPILIDLPRLLTTPEAARYLGISHVSLWRRVRDRDIQAVRIGRSVRFDRIELDRFIDAIQAEQSVPPMKPPGRESVPGRGGVSKP